MNKQLIAILLVAFVTTACTYNKQTRAGERVELVKPVYTTTCKYLGTVEARVTTIIGGITVMGEKKTEKELLNIAKNNAAEMHGDTLVKKSGVRNGRQTFKVYRCKR